jgi:hypothetical protein
MSRELKVFASLSDLSIFYPSWCSLKLDFFFLNYGRPFYSYNPPFIDIGGPRSIDFVGVFGAMFTLVCTFFFLIMFQFVHEG